MQLVKKCELLISASEKVPEIIFVLHHQLFLPLPALGTFPAEQSRGLRMLEARTCSLKSEKVFRSVFSVRRSHRCCLTQPGRAAALSGSNCCGIGLLQRRVTTSPAHPSQACAPLRGAGSSPHLWQQHPLGLVGLFFLLLSVEGAASISAE